MVEDKNSSVYLRVFTEFFYTDLFSFLSTNACLLGDAKSLVKRNAFNIIDEIFENLNTVSNIFKESHNFLVFEGSVTTYISLRKNQLKVPP